MTETEHSCEAITRKPNVTQGSMEISGCRTCPGSGPRVCYRKPGAGDADAGPLKESEELFNLALESMANRTPDDPKVRAIALLNFSALLYQTNRYERATPMLDEALELSVKHFGPDHSLTANVLKNRGILKAMQGRTKPAQDDLEKSWPSLKSTLTLKRASWPPFSAALRLCIQCGRDTTMRKNSAPFC
jgi:tetratricopeptide (TPR) repeat protein